MSTISYHYAVMVKISFFQNNNLVYIYILSSYTTLENISISCPKKLTFTSRKIVYLKSIKDKKAGAFIVEEFSLFQQAYENFFLILSFNTFLTDNKVYL